jgi:hypothetical protein
MNIIRTIKKTDFYLTLVVLYIIFGMYKQYEENFLDFRYWDLDLQIAGALAILIVAWKAYRLLLLKNKIIL